MFNMMILKLEYIYINTLNLFTHKCPSNWVASEVNNFRLHYYNKRGLPNQQKHYFQAIQIFVKAKSMAITYRKIYHWLISDSLCDRTGENMITKQVLQQLSYLAPAIESVWLSHSSPLCDLCPKDQHPRFFSLAWVIETFHSMGWSQYHIDQMLREGKKHDKSDRDSSPGPLNL